MNKNLFAIVCIILAGLLYPTFVLPLWGEINKLQDQKAQIVKGQKDVDNFIKRYDELKTVADTFPEEDIDRLSQILPKSVNVIGTIVDIENIIRENGFVLKGSVGVDDKKEAKGSNQESDTASQATYDTTTFTLNVVGLYSSLEPLLENFAKSLTLFDITSLSFSTSDTSVYDFNISLRTYSLHKK